MSIVYAENPVHTGVIALLKGQGLSVHVGKVSDADDNAKTISAPMPYLLYLPALDHATSRRAGGWSGYVTEFSVHFAAASVLGADNYARGVRDFLCAATVMVDGKARRIRMYNPNEPVDIADDPTWNRPDGGHIFFGRMEFYVA